MSEKPNPALDAFFAEAATANRESSIAAAAGLEALARVVHAAWSSRTSGQSVRLMRILASLYNGTEAEPIDLADATGGLDWSLKKDICAVILGKGLDGFPDTKIRDAFREVGGAAGVTFLHEQVSWRPLYPKARLVGQA
jgi:hypothetical protein